MKAVAITREFRELPSTDGYLLDLAELGTEFRVERLRRERGELIGELTVRCGLPGTRSSDGVLSVADFNLSSARARQERGRILADRSGAADVDWTGFLEELCQHVIASERTGRPAVLLRDVPRPLPGEDIEVDPGIRLLRRHPSILFGDGGALKSYTALHWATRLSDAGLRVLFVDWEFAGEDHRDRLERLTGENMPDVRYVRCDRPLTAEVDRLRRIVREETVDYVIFDSIAFACDGPPESAEIAGAYFRAVRRIGVGSLHVAHVTKAEGGEYKPFGSSFWHNGARSTWYIKRSAEASGPGGVTVGLYNRKANMGPLAPAVGYTIDFDEDRTSFSRTSIADTVDLAHGLPMRERMSSLLRTGAMKMVEIAEELDTTVDHVAKVVKRDQGHRFTKVLGEDSVYRIGLSARGVA